MSNMVRAGWLRWLAGGMGGREVGGWPVLGGRIIGGWVPSCPECGGGIGRGKRGRGSRESR